MNETQKEIMKYQTLIKTHSSSIETCKRKIIELRSQL